MKAQQDNLILSSLSLLIDHEIQSQGQAYRNTSGLFYPDKSKVNGLHSYTCSYKQLCNDVSISGASVLSGVYVGGVFTPIGSGNLVSINHYNGCANFSAQVSSTISGAFGVKEFSIYISDQPDYSVVLSNKYHMNPKYSQTATGIPQETVSMPAVILVPKEQEARPLAFAGVDDNYMKVRAIIVSETSFQRVAVSNILKNLNLRNLPIFTGIPFDYNGNLTGSNYNFKSMGFRTDYMPFIRSVRITQIPNHGTVSETTKQFAFADFEISSFGGHL